MKIVKTAGQLRSAFASTTQPSRIIGFVPTMGALHAGHLSLVQRCKSQNDLTVASIFVNPTQFNDPQDLRNYPRMPEHDLELLEQAGCDLIFMPEEKEVYPDPDTRIFNLGNLGTVMEGKFRPGHFNGVVQVVTRLFDLVKPQRAYFGLKDYQQLAVIRKIVNDLHIPVEIVACPIVREPDGLAMSSRNLLLTSEQRQHAALISDTLFKAREMMSSFTPDEIRKFVKDRIDRDPFLETEYFEIAHDTTLQPVSSWKEPGGKIGCVAAWAGRVRLIDNIIFSS